MLFSTPKTDLHTCRRRRRRRRKRRLGWCVGTVVTRYHWVPRFLERRGGVYVWMWTPKLRKNCGWHSLPVHRVCRNHLLLQTPITLNKTKICALAFWIDFCISVVPRPLIIRIVHSSKTFEPTYSIFCPSISFPPKITPAQVRLHVKNLLVSIFQVIDRIAKTHECPKLTQEYTLSFSSQFHNEATNISCINIPWLHWAGMESDWK